MAPSATTPTRPTASPSPSNTTTTAAAAAAVSADELTIPLIDFSLFHSGTPAERASTAAAIVHGFKTAGFIYLRNLPIPASTIAAVFAHSARFFARPQAQKDALSWTTPESNRGYVSAGREKVSQITSRDEVEALRVQAPDLKETIEIGPEGKPDQNQWPDGFDDEGKRFKEVMQAFFLDCQALNVQVMRAIATGMGLGEGFFDKYTDGACNNLRLLHYPPVKREVFAKNKSQVRAGVHTDYGSITLLFQDSRGGLQVQSPGGAFVDATPIPDTVVVNAGDLLARWSNDAIRSTKHRVIEPPRAAGDNGDEHPARYSVAYFCNPNEEALIEALPGTWDGDKGGKRYPAVNSKEYLTARLAATI